MVLKPWLLLKKHLEVVAQLKVEEKFNVDLIWLKYHNLPDLQFGQQEPNHLLQNMLLLNYLKNSKERKMELEFHSNKWFFLDAKMSILELVYMLDLMTLIPQWLNFSIKLYSTIMVTKKKINILVTWIIPNSTAHLLVQKMLLWLSQPELELEET